MQTYWNGKGKHQRIYEKLWDKLVPATGRAKSLAGELLRAISSIYYDRYNNGFGNGPFLCETGLLSEYQKEIKHNMKTPFSFDKFVDIFSVINYGKQELSFQITKAWDGDKHLESVMDGVVLFANKLSPKRGR